MRARRVALADLGLRAPSPISRISGTDPGKVDRLSVEMCLAPCVAALEQDHLAQRVGAGRMAAALRRRLKSGSSGVAACQPSAPGDLVARCQASWGAL